MAKAERENIINWTEGEKTARIYITSRKLKNRLEKYGVKPVEQDEAEPYGATYEVSRNWVRIQKPSGEGRVRTKAQRAAAIERLAKARTERAARRAAEEKAAPKKAPKAVEAEDEETETPAPKKSLKSLTKPSKPAPAPAVVEDDDEEVEVVKPKKKKPAADED